MQIAITSQNRRTITGHAGKCRNFWLYQIDAERCVSKTLVELPIEQTFHASHDTIAAPLSAIDVLITGGMGHGLHQRLSHHGIVPVVTCEAEPDRAIAQFLAGSLDQAPRPE